MLRREATADRIRRVLRDRSRAGAAVIVPGVFWVEVVNVLARRHRYSGNALLESVAVLDALGITTVEGSRAGLLMAIDAVVSHELTAYDAVYLALASSADADLLTLDHALAAAGGARSLSTGVYYLREARAPNRRETWITWEGLHDYLAGARRAEAGRS